MKRVSIIIPVYNVEVYIDQCLESVCSQTYQNLDIILVYDESEDLSYKKCLEWLKKDTRIRLIYNQIRKGLGAARNQAIKKAMGDYITFLDSDDWIERTYIERFCKFFEENDVDFIISGDWNNVEGEGIIFKHNFPQVILDRTTRILALWAFPTAWGKIFKREWIIKYKIYNPEIFHCEDWSTLPLMVLQAKSIGIMQGPGVFYRVARAGALTDTSNYISILKDAGLAFEYFLKYTVINNFFNENRIVLEKYCKEIYFTLLSRSIQNKTKEGFDILENVNKDVLSKYFPHIFQEEQARYYLFGSFSLRWEFQRTFRNWREHMDHYCFSSIISAMSPCNNIKVKHDNNFRQEQIERDITSDILSKVNENQNKAFFLMDFLEERNNILELSDMGYCTYSEAFKEANFKECCASRVIQNNTSEFWTLWIRKCDELIAFLNQHFLTQNIVLVRNRLALFYNSKYKMELYENQENLKKTNKMIERMENYFITHCQGITVIDPNRKYLFSDEFFRQGCKPEHINDIFYEQVSIMLYEKLVWKGTN